MDPQRLAARTLAVALAVGLLAELLLRGHALGPNLALVIAAALLAALRAQARPRRHRPARRLDPAAGDRHRRLRGDPGRRTARGP